MADFICGLFIFLLFLFLLIKIFTDCKICSGTGVRQIRITGKDGRIIKTINTGEICEYCKGSGKRKKSSSIFHFQFSKIPLEFLKEKYKNDENLNVPSNIDDDYVIVNSKDRKSKIYFNKNNMKFLDKCLIYLLTQGSQDK